MGTNFIITPEQSYCYEENKIYTSYYDYENYFIKYIGPKNYVSAIIFNEDKRKVTKIINSSMNGFIRIFNFHSGKLLSKILMENSLYGICLWNKNNIFVGCGDHTIRLIDINKGVVVKNKNLYGHNHLVCSIKKINHPKFGECLISQGLAKDNIELWINNKYLN